ncbi:MAG: hypothetical protein JNJ44_03315 [Zoogloeaceae bacterium]|nr:hypothetical protein [Zoogloeaceae bacterium]
MIAPPAAIDYRLVWFQHFHKAAGTSVIEMARQNGEQFFPRHENGNPLDAAGRPIPLWQFSPDELLAFVDDCQSQGVSFVATEWGVPHLECLAADPRVRLVTCLRDPLKRLVSNYYYDLYGGHTEARSLEAYPESGPDAFCHPNYYCHMLGAEACEAAAAGSTPFQRAQARLALFDYCGTVEAGLDRLARALGWQAADVRENTSDAGAGQLVNDLLKGRLRSVFYRLRYPKAPPPKHFRAEFRRRNQWDLALYAQVKGLSQRTSL